MKIPRKPPNLNRILSELMQQKEGLSKWLIPNPVQPVDYINLTSFCHAPTISDKSYGRISFDLKCRADF